MYFKVHYRKQKIHIDCEVKGKKLFVPSCCTRENNARAIYTVFKLADHVPVALVAILLVDIFEKNKSLAAKVSAYSFP